MLSSIGNRNNSGRDADLNSKASDHCCPGSTSYSHILNTSISMKRRRITSTLPTVLVVLKKRINKIKETKIFLLKHKAW